MAKKLGTNIRDLEHLGPLVRELDERDAKRKTGLWGVKGKPKKEARKPLMSDPVRHSPISPHLIRKDLLQSEKDWKDVKEGLVTRMLARRMDPDTMNKVDPMPEGHLALKEGKPLPKQSRVFARRQILKPRHLAAFEPPESKPDLFIDRDPMAPMPAPPAMPGAHSDDPDSFPKYSPSQDKYADTVLEVAKQKVAKLLEELQQKDPFAEDEEEGLGSTLSLADIGQDVEKDTAKERLKANRQALDLIAIPGVDEEAGIRGLNEEGKLEDPDNMSEYAASRGRNFEGRSGYTPFQRELGQTRDKYPTAKGHPTRSFRIKGLREEGLTTGSDIADLPVNARTAVLQQLAEGGWSDEMKRLIEAIKSDKELLGPDAREKGEPHDAYLEDMANSAARESSIKDEQQDEYDPTSDDTKDMVRGREGSVIPKVFGGRESWLDRETRVPTAPRLPKRPADAKRQEIYTSVTADPEKEKKLPFNKRGKNNKVYKSADRYPASPFANTKALIRKVQEEGEKKAPHSRVSIPARLAGKGATAEEALAKVTPRAFSMAERGFRGPGVEPGVASRVGPRVNLDVLRAILGLDETPPEGPGFVREGVSRYRQRQAETAKERRKLKKIIENEG